jgi:fimbrial chaperone protein
MAASFTVNPVRVDLAAERPYMVMQITDTDDAPVTLQARTYRWTESDISHGGGLVSTDDLILNPPLLTIAPHTTRFLRLGLRAVNRGVTELSYRLVLQEVPKAVAAGDNGAVLRTIVRMTIPVFAVPTSPAASKPDWALQQVGMGKFKLVLTNKGTAHIHLLKLGISPVDQTNALKTLNAPIYVLPGQSYTWEIESPELTGQKQVKITGNDDAGKVEATVQATYPNVAANPN